MRARSLRGVRSRGRRVEHRQLDVFDRARPRQQIVGLEDEAQAPAADVGALVGSQVTRRRAFEAVGSRASAGRASPTMCMNVDLPEPDGPMTATNSPGSIVEIDAAQRVNALLAQRVDVAQVARLRRRAPLVDPSHRAADRRRADRRRARSAARRAAVRAPVPIDDPVARPSARRPARLDRGLRSVRQANVAPAPERALPLRSTSEPRRRARCDCAARGPSADAAPRRRRSAARADVLAARRAEPSARSARWRRRSSRSPSCPVRAVPPAIVGEDDDVVGHDVVERLRVDPDLRDRAVEEFDSDRRAPRTTPRRPA